MQIIALLIIALTVFLIARRYQTHAILFAAGFAKYMSLISASTALVNLSIKPLSRISNPYSLLAINTGLKYRRQHRVRWRRPASSRACRGRC